MKQETNRKDKERLFETMFGKDEGENKGTHRVQITIEHVFCKAFDISLDNEEYESLVEGDTTPLKKRGLYKLALQDAKPADTDYAVYDYDLEKQVVDWR